MRGNIFNFKMNVPKYIYGNKNKPPISFLLNCGLTLSKNFHSGVGRRSVKKANTVLLASWAPRDNGISGIVSRDRDCSLTKAKLVHRERSATSRAALTALLG